MKHEEINFIFLVCGAYSFHTVCCFQMDIKNKTFTPLTEVVFYVGIGNVDSFTTHSIDFSFTKTDVICVFLFSCTFNRPESNEYARYSLIYNLHLPLHEFMDEKRKVIRLDLLGMCKYFHSFNGKSEFKNDIFSFQHTKQWIRFPQNDHKLFVLSEHPTTSLEINKVLYEKDGVYTLFNVHGPLIKMFPICGDQVKFLRFIRPKIPLAFSQKWKYLENENLFECTEFDEEKLSALSLYKLIE